jgi:hypothetical protein
LSWSILFEAFSTHEATLLQPNQEDLPESKGLLIECCSCEKGKKPTVEGG